MPVFYVKPLSDAARALYESHGTFHAGDCGLDLFTVKDVVAPAGQTVFLRLGVQVECKDDARGGRNLSYYMYPRSSVSKTPLRLANSVGIIDSGYRGELVAAFDNTDRARDYHVKAGTRLVQLCTPTLSNQLSCKVVRELSSSSRGCGALGSTGK